jgi:hypothetical protein
MYDLRDVRRVACANFLRARRSLGQLDPSVVKAVAKSQLVTQRERLRDVLGG